MCPCSVGLRVYRWGFVASAKIRVRLDIRANFRKIFSENFSENFSPHVSRFLDVLKASFLERGGWSFSFAGPAACVPEVSEALLRRVSEITEIRIIFREGANCQGRLFLTRVTQFFGNMSSMEGMFWLFYVFYGRYVCLSHIDSLGRCIPSGTSAGLSTPCRGKPFCAQRGRLAPTGEAGGPSKVAAAGSKKREAGVAGLPLMCVGFVAFPACRGGGLW